ncbi:hypothetical protein A2310_01065 [candidate division WOR-1 bacterium RIFOXYB2_FULL_37_13]|uniref:Transporter n=1 Tax=candidate division WOR-1 bacterium RIFOXYB2_FULL_37_13 TaxID=1802579 RepID=A0A1F4SNC3_UNCSA|nr:MAG: hypothetical protein A2310_01065 [candidate division WOR-1 bacterium RIFOXYB2_FULL_37_13]
MKIIFKSIFFIFLFFIFSGSSFADSQVLTLDQSIKIALERNTQVLSAREKLNASGARFNQALGSVLPSISLSSSFGKSYQQPLSLTIPGMTTPITTSPDEAAEMTTYSFSLRQPVFTGGKLLLGIKITNNSYLAALQDFKKVKNDVIYNVVSGYYEYLKSKKMVEVVNSSMIALKKHLKQVELFYNSGISTQVDLLRTQTELANMRNTQIQVETGLQLASISFNSLLGKDISSDIFLSSDAPQTFEGFASYSGLLEKAYNNRPDWISFKLGKEIAEDTVGLNTGNLLPNIFLVGSTGRTVTNYASSNTKYDLGSWNLLLSGSWVLFDGFVNVNKIAEAKATAQSLKEQEKSLKDAIALDLKAAYLNFGSAKERLSAAEYAKSLAEKTLKYAELNFVSNVGTNLSVLDAESALLQAQANYWTALYDIRIAKAKIDKAVGISGY